LPNIAAILKQEISRVARREVRSLTKSLHKASAQYRRDIAELKRRNAKAQAEIARLERSKGALPPKANGADTENVRFSVKSVKSQRKRLGVSAGDFGKVIGVSAATVYNWEHGTSKPRRTQLATLAGLRGLGKKEVRERLEQMNGKGSSRLVR